MDESTSMETRTGVLHTWDVDEQREVAQPWDLILRQMSAGPFHGRLEYVYVNGILLYRERWTRRIVGTGKTPAGYYMLGGPSLPGTRIDWCGTTLGPTRLALANPSTEVEFVTPEGSDHVVLLIPEKLLSEHLGEHLTREASIRGRKYLTCHAALGHEIVRTLTRLIVNVLENDALLAHDRKRKAVEWQLLETIGRAIEAVNGVSDSPPRSKRRRRCRQQQMRPQALTHRRVQPLTGLRQRMWR